MDMDDVGEVAILMLVLYCLIGAILTYPALVVGKYSTDLYGLDVGFWAWIISVGVLIVLYFLRQFWLILIIYLVTLIPFIFLCIAWWKELYGG